MQINLSSSDVRALDFAVKEILNICTGGCVAIPVSSKIQSDASGTELSRSMRRKIQINQITPNMMQAFAELKFSSEVDVSIIA
jgi:ribosomal protein S10